MEIRPSRAAWPPAPHPCSGSISAASGSGAKRRASPLFSYNTPQYLTNASVTYRGFEDIAITVGATNLFNTQPPVDPFDPTGSTAGINNLEPGFLHVRLARDF